MLHVSDIKGKNETESDRKLFSPLLGPYLELLAVRSFNSKLLFRLTQVCIDGIA